MFRDRRDAGVKLGKALGKYRGSGALVLAIPRGGVEVGFPVAKALGLEFDMIVSRKLPSPEDPEAGFGAVAEDGSFYILDFAKNMYGDDVIKNIVQEQKKEAKRRVTALRGGKPITPLAGRDIILVDDGIAMGVTLRAAIMMCRKQGAGRIIVAAPVSGRPVAREIGKLVDSLVVLDFPDNFHAVAQDYGEWHDLSDEEVLEIIKG